MRQHAIGELDMEVDLAPTMDAVLVVVPGNRVFPLGISAVDPRPKVRVFDHRADRFGSRVPLLFVEEILDFRPLVGHPFPELTALFITSLLK